MIGDFDIKCAPIILLYHDNFYMCEWYLYFYLETIRLTFTNEYLGIEEKSRLRRLRRRKRHVEVDGFEGN